MPLKVNIGDMVLGIEAGANAVVFTRGYDACRYGFYWVMQKKILERHFRREIPFLLFYHHNVLLACQEMFRMLKLNISDEEFFSILRRSVKKLDVLISTERLTNKVRPKEIIKGETDKIYNNAIELLDNAQTDREIKKTERKIIKMYKNIQKKIFFNPLKAGLIGEIFEILEPTSNLYIERKLGNMGVEVVRMLDYNNLVPFGRTRRFVPFLRRLRDEYNFKKSFKIAQKYLGILAYSGFGGYGTNSIINAGLAKKRGFDGIIQISPFTCMPEIIARPILRNICKKQNIPFLSLVTDEHSGEQGFDTRLEAFVDILKNRQKKRSI